jgi:hypothetical protein
MLATRRWLPIPLLALSVSAANADTLAAATPPEDPARTQQILSKSLPLARGEERDVAPDPDDGIRLHFDRGTGLALRKPVRVSDHELVFGLKGPLMKKNRVGLAFEVRF